MNTSVLVAVFKRNFVSYFSNPTGYLFICVFVLLSSIAAFWPAEFFNTNLANLDQLNNNPYLNFFTIMLVFIPAITMGIWSDERRQGTDELLLTIPAGDFDVVLGKYLAAVAVFTVSLLYSLACNYGLLKLLLGNPDVGLFLGTYAGYWLVGLAMLAIGMVGSFLTGNLTIAFVLGVLFNAPLVLIAIVADAAAEFLLSPEAVTAVKPWGLHAQFQDFSRGVLSTAAAAYFVLIVAVMLYLGVILIGRRHWRSGRGTTSSAIFYTVLHVLWAVSFAGLAVLLLAPGLQALIARGFPFAAVLGPYCTPAAILTCLAIAYLVLHWALLRRSAREPREPSQASGFRLAPVLHVAVLALVAVVVLAIYGFRHWAPIPAGVLLGLFVVYLLALAGLAAGWWRYPQGDSLVPGHCIVRLLALLLAAAGLTMILQRHDARLERHQRTAQLALAADAEAADRVEVGPAGADRGLRQPHRPRGLRADAFELAQHAPRGIQARRPDKIEVQIRPTERLSEEEVLAERALRHHPPPRRTPRGRHRGRRQHLPRRGHDLRPAKGDRAFHRPGHSRRIRDHPLAVHGGAAEAEAGGHPRHQRPPVRRHELPDLQPQPQLADHRRAAEAVRSGARGRQQADHRALRRVAGGAAVNAGPR